MKTIAAIIAALVVIGGGVYLYNRYNSSTSTDINLGGGLLGTSTATSSDSSDAGTTSTSTGFLNRLRNDLRGAASNTLATTSEATTTLVRVSDNGFSPSTVTIPKGGKVTWINEGSAAHNVTEQGGTALTRFKSPNLSQGETYSHTFNTAGTYNYYCTIDPAMKGKVIVK